MQVNLTIQVYKFRKSVNVSERELVVFFMLRKWNKMWRKRSWCGFKSEENNVEDGIRIICKNYGEGCEDFCFRLNTSDSDFLTIFESKVRRNFGNTVQYIVS